MLSTAVTFSLYGLVMLLIGVVAYQRTTNLGDYLLAGRGLGRWVTALSAGASDMSGWLLLGLPGFAYAAGLEAGWLALGLLLGTYANWRWVAARLRTATVTYGNALTLPDFFAQRFDDRNRLLRVVAAVLILVFFTFYTSAGLVAGGKLFNTVFELPYLWAVTAGAAAVLIYTFLGGFLAVAWTDLIQGLLMFAALVAVPLIVLGSDGLGSVNTVLLDPFTDQNGNPLGLIAIFSLLGWGLGYFGQPHILIRFMAIRDVEEIGPARRIAVGWVTVTLVGAVLVGLAGVNALPQTLSEAETETVFIRLVEVVFHPLVAGVLLSAILAAIMSTADSQLLVASSALAEDFYKALWQPGASQRKLVWVGRGAVVLIAVIAFVLALNPERKVLDLVAHAWAGFGAAFGPVVLLSLYWQRMTRNAALAGMVVGSVTVMVWGNMTGGLFELYELVPGFFFSMAAIALVARLQPTARA